MNILVRLFSLALLGLLGLIRWLWDKIFGGGSGTAGPLPLPPPYPPVAGSMSVVAGTVLIPQGRWSGPDRHARRTIQTYNFLRQVYNPAAPGDPLSPVRGIHLRFRVVHSPEENVEITDVTNGNQVSGSPWWSAVTGDNGEIVVDVNVAGRETASWEQSLMQIIAEELAPNGRVLRGAKHDVIVVPTGH